MGCGGPRASPWNLGNYGNGLRMTTNTGWNFRLCSRPGRNGKVRESFAPFFSLFLFFPFFSLFLSSFSTWGVGREGSSWRSPCPKTLMKGQKRKFSRSLNFCFILLFLAHCIQSSTSVTVVTKATLRRNLCPLSDVHHKDSHPPRELLCSCSMHPHHSPAAQMVGSLPYR